VILEGSGHKCVVCIALTNQMFVIAGSRGDKALKQAEIEERKADLQKRKHLLDVAKDKLARELKHAEEGWEEMKGRCGWRVSHIVMATSP